MSFLQYGRQHATCTGSSETSIDGTKITSLHSSHPLCSSSMSSLVPQNTMNDYSSRSHDYIYSCSHNNNNNNYRRRCYSLSTSQSYNNNTNSFDKDEIQYHHPPIHSQSTTIMDMMISTTNVDEPLSSRIFMQPSMLLLQFGFSYLFQKRHAVNTTSTTNYLSLSTVVCTIVLYSLSSHIFRRSIRKRLQGVAVHDSCILPTTRTCFRQPMYVTTSGSNNDDNSSTLLMIPDTILNVVLVLIMIQQSIVAYQILFIVSMIMILVAMSLSINRWIQQRTIEYSMSDITLRHALLGFDLLYYSSKR